MVRIQKKQKIKSSRQLLRAWIAVFGAINGGLVDLLGDSVGLVVDAAAGAVTGGVAAGKIDIVFP